MIVRLAIIWIRHSWNHPQKAEMEREAISLATTGVLGNPYSLPTGPSAHVSPGYALLLAGIYYAFGTGIAGETVKVLLTCLISSMQYALLPWFGKVLKMPSAIGLAAGVFGALIPLNPYIEVQGDFENHVTALLILLLIVWTEFATSRAWSTVEAVGFGLFAGACLLTTSILAPLCTLSLAYIGLQQLKMPRGRPHTALLSLAALLFCIAPWAVRNRVQLGSAIATRSNFGIEFSLANNDLASPLMGENGRLYFCCHPLQNAGEARKIQQVGEVAYNRRLMQTAVAWVKAHPIRFAQLTAQRFWFTWIPQAPEWPRKVVFWILTPLAFWGVVMIWNIRRKSAVLIAAPMLVYPLPYYLIQVHLRYRYPLEFLLLFAAWATVTAFTTRTLKARAG